MRRRTPIRSGRGAWRTEEGGGAFARRHVRRHAVHDGPGQMAEPEAAFGGGKRDDAAAVSVHMPARVIGGGGLVSRRCGIGGGMTAVSGRAVVVMMVMVVCVTRVRRPVEGRQHGGIAVQARRAHGDGNPDDTQKLAGQAAHGAKQAQKLLSGQAE